MLELVVGVGMAGVCGWEAAGRGGAVPDWMVGGAFIWPREEAAFERPSSSEWSVDESESTGSGRLSRRFIAGILGWLVRAGPSIENGSSSNEPTTEIMWLAIVKLLLRPKNNNKRTWI
jgi:hypothetical protein